MRVERCPSTAYRYFFTKETTREEISLTPILRDVKYNKIATDLIINHTYKVKEDHSKKITYALARIAGYGGGHSSAYIKDLTFSSENFILCDDLSSKHKIVEILKKVRLCQQLNLC